ncbi:MAG: TolC family protein [Terriglobia bacterium]
MRDQKWKLLFYLTGVCFFFAHELPAAQTGTTKTFTVQEAVSFALQNYPAVRAALESYNAARAGVGVANTHYLPRVDAVWQGNRGTRNSVLGVLLPQFPNILTGTQGAVLAPSNRSFWASGAGVLFSWEPFDFGYRRSQVRSAQSTATQTAAQVTLTRLGVATSVTDASLAVLADEQRVAASQADVDRRTVFGQSVHALVNARLRPGADASRADAELAAARTQLILAQESLQIASGQLATVLGISGTHVEIETGPFLQIPPENIWGGTPVTLHPAAVVGQRRIQEAQSRISVLNHAYYPHFTLEALTSARGSGENSKGNVAPGFNGLGADVHNWSAGLTVSLPVFDFISIHERRKVELANRRREQALYDLTVQTLSGQLEQARATLDGARRVAQNTPIELQASRDSEAQARARFHAGVGTIVDVAEAQRLLVQAEIDDSLARLAIWRALADLAAAQGDVQPLLNLAATVQTGDH